MEQEMDRCEGLPNEIFHPCALWAGGRARWKNCRHVAVVVVGVIWNFRSTFRPGNYNGRFSDSFEGLVRDLEEWAQGLYTEFYCASHKYSGWGLLAGHF